MRLVTFEEAGLERVGVWLNDDKEVLDLSAADPTQADFVSMLTLIDGGADALDRARAVVASPPAHAVLPTTAVRLRAPIRPRRIWAAPIMDLERHTRTMNRRSADRIDAINGQGKQIVKTLDAVLDRIAASEEVYSEARDHLYISGPEDVISTAGYAAELDYEVELGCVLGKAGRDITRDDAASHIFGYTIFNDWSARDEQIRNIMRGAGWGGTAKDFDGSTSLGPCIVTRDGLDPYDLAMIARVNGEEWTRGHSSEHISTFEDRIVSLSRGRTVFAGEVWCSGTVGPGCGMELDRTLPDGAIVEIEVEGIGVLRNKVSIAR
ncbi:fumarylacetoacetate hydrolase family protein [Streptomyces sp. NPDC101455]|uniref:fumarylacetoacetate hydrolase family protein n=1 Tax=Streptomyces sp. NPDC101455 TaxID=3366142 RepID=UPI0038307846